MWGKSKFDIGEEETKVRKSIGRLIHTLQHFPSKRSGLDTTSLLNLVGELESFNPERKTKSLQFTQTTERRTYSRKYLDLTFAPGWSGESRQAFKNCKPGHQFSNKPSTKNFNQFKDRDFQRQKMSNIPSCGSRINKVGTSKEVGKKTNGKVLKNEEVKKKNLEKSGASRCNDFSRNNKKNESIVHQNKNIQNLTKQPITKIDKSINVTNKKSKINQKERSYCNKLPTKYKFDAVRADTRSNKQNKNVTFSFKCKSHQCTPTSNKALQKIILDNNQSSIDRSSVVKKLTSYWNNLLSNDFDRDSSTPGSYFGGSCRNVQILDHSSLGATDKSETPSENGSSTLKSRHLSESNINIMKRVDDLHSKRIINAVQDSIHKLSTEKKNPSTESVNTCCVSPSAMSNEDFITTLEEKELNHFNSTDFSSLLSTKDAVQVLQNTITMLMSLPECKIQSFTKKLLYIMVVSSKFTSQHDKFINKLEAHADKMIKEIVDIKQDINGTCGKTITPEMNKLEDDIPVGHILSAFNDNLEIDMDFISKNKKEENNDSPPQKCLLIKCEGEGSQSEMHEVATDKCRVTLDSGNSLTLLSSRIDLNKVENALNLFLIWREIVLSNSSNDYEDIIVPNFERPQYHSFTIIYQEDIVFEDDSSNEDSFMEDTNTESETNNMFRTASETLEKYVDKVIDCIENYFPDSPEVFIRMVYQYLVSILIWWVIVKDIFVK